MNEKKKNDHKQDNKIRRKVSRYYGADKTPRIGPHSKIHLIKMIRIVENRDVNPNEMHSPFVNSFLDSIPYFQALKKNIPAEAYEKMSKQFVVKKYRHLEQIINFGSIPNFFFVLITGSVYVLIKKTGIDIQHKEGKAKARNEGKRLMRDIFNPLNQLLNGRRKKTQFFGKRFMKMFDSQKEKEQMRNDPVYISQNYPDMICIRTLDAPSHFGGLAIEQDTVRKRTATILSKGKSIVFAFPLNVFRKMKRYMADPQLRAKCIFLQKVPIFNHWSMVNLVELLYHLKTYTFRNARHVFKVGESDNNIYIVKKGKFEFKYRLIKKIDKAFVDKRIIKLVKIEKKLMNKYQDIPISILGEQQVAGIYEHYEKMKQKVTSLRAVTEGAELFVVDAEKFFTVISDQITLESLYKIYESRKQFIQDKINSILNMKQKVETSFDYKESIREQFSSKKVNSMSFYRDERENGIDLRRGKKVFKMSSKVEEIPEHERINKRAVKILGNRFFEWVSDEEDGEELEEESNRSNGSIDSLFYDLEAIKHKDSAHRKMISCQKYLENSLRKKLKKAVEEKGKRSQSYSVNISKQQGKKKIMSNTIKRQKRLAKMKKNRERTEEIVQRIIGVKGNLENKFLNKMETDSKDAKEVGKRLELIKTDVKNRFKDEFDIIEYLKKDVRVKQKHDSKNNHRFYSNDPDLRKSRLISNIELRALTSSLIPNSSVDKKSSKLLYKFLRSNITTYEDKGSRNNEHGLGIGQKGTGKKTLFLKKKGKKVKDVENSGGKMSFMLHNEMQLKVGNEPESPKKKFFFSKKQVKRKADVKSSSKNKSRMMLRRSNKKQKKIVNYHMHNLRNKAKKRLRSKRLAMSLGNALQETHESKGKVRKSFANSSKKMRNSSKKHYRNFSINSKAVKRGLQPEGNYKIIRKDDPPIAHNFFHLND